LLKHYYFKKAAWAFIWLLFYLLSFFQSNLLRLLFSLSFAVLKISVIFKIQIALFQVNDTYTMCFLWLRRNSSWFFPKSWWIFSSLDTDEFLIHTGSRRQPRRWAHKSGLGLRRYPQKSHRFWLECYRQGISRNICKERSSPSCPIYPEKSKKMISNKPMNRPKKYPIWVLIVG
jgi:hypothetical protein